MAYDPQQIEPRWQKYWETHQTFKAPDVSDKPKYYVLDMFPYPSGDGLHVGHPEGYTATDIVSRFKRMNGFNVIHPMGYDAFGLPAEQYAVEHGVHPRETTTANIANIERQIRMFGFSYDWSRRLATTDPDYYRWTQWGFLRMFEGWYDPSVDAARPIAELVAALESGRMGISATGEPTPDLSHAISALGGQEGGTAKWHAQQAIKALENEGVAEVIPACHTKKLAQAIMRELKNLDQLGLYRGRAKTCSLGEFLE